MGLISDSFLNLPPDDDDLRPPVTPGLPAADPSQAPAPAAASPAPVSFYAANSPDGRTSGRFVVGPRRLAGDPAPAAPLPAPDPTTTLTAPAAPALPAPSVPSPSDPTRISASFGGSTPAYSSQPAPAPAIGSRLDDVDPDTAVSLGLSDASATTGVTAAPPAPAAAVPKVPSSGSTGAPPATNAPATASSADPDINSLLGGSDPDADAKAQYARDNAASLKFFKSQGGVTQIDPTGAEVPVYDAQGGLAYKPTTINPVQQRPDGRFVRVDRDATGNYKDFDLLNEGADGVDYHTNPQDGTQFVQVPAGNGQSRRVVIGQDNFIPVANGIKALAQSHQQDAEQAGQAATQAEQGVAGGDGYDVLSLSQLKESQTAAAQAAATAQKTLSQFAAYKAAGNGLNATQLNQIDAATTTANHFGGLAQEQADEIASRQQAITAAQQQRTASMGAFRDAQIVHGQIQAARTDDGSTLSRNLQAVDAGHDIDPVQARRYTAAGLLTSQPQADGSTALQLTDTARALLPKPDAPKPAPAQAVDSTAGQTAPASQSSAAGDTASAPGQSKGYSVAADGSLQLDPTQAPLGLLSAAKDGVISQAQLAQHLPAASQAQLAIDNSNQYATTNPGLSGQLKAFGGSLLQGITSGIGTLVRSPLGQGVAAGYDLATGNWDGLTKATGSPEEQQAKALGDAIQHSTDGFVSPDLQNTIGAKVGGFIGGVAPYAAVGALGTPVLAATLFSSGYQSQYESAKAKLAATAQQTGQPVDGDHVEAAAHTAGLLGGAINTVLALPVGKAVSAVARVFGAATPSAISQGIITAFENGGAKGVLDTIADISSQGVGPEVQEALKTAATQISKTIGARVFDVAKTAAKDSAVGAGAQVGQNIIAQQTYDPDRSLFEGVPEQAVGFGLMGAGTGVLNEGTSALELAKGRVFAARQSGNNTGPVAGGLTDSGNPPSGPTPHPADLAKPVVGRVVSSGTASPSSPAPSEPVPDSQLQSPPGSPLETRQASSSQSFPGSPDSLVSIPIAPGVSSSPTGTSLPSTGAPAAGQASPAPGSQDDDKQRQPDQTLAPSTPGQSTPASASTSPDALSALTKLRDGQAAMIQGGKFSEAELPTAQAMLDHLNAQVARAQQAPPDPGMPAAPATPGAAASGTLSPAPTSVRIGDTLVNHQGDRHTISRVDAHGHAWTQEDPNNPGYVGIQLRHTPETIQNLLNNGGRIEPGARPASSDAPAPGAPASTAPAESTPGASSAPASGEGAAPRPPAGMSPDGFGSEPSTDNSTKTQSGPVLPASEPPTETHGDLADLVNGGIATDNPDGRPSTTFQVLQRLKAGGAPITPEVARDVSNQVAAIRGNADLDMPAKQEALRSIVRSHLPTEQHQDTPSDIPSSSSATAAQSANDLRGTTSETSTAPANGGTPEPDEPQPIAAPRQTEDRVVPTPAGPKLVPADSDETAAARTWLANQRDAGRNPASAEVARQTGVDFNTASRLRVDQSAAELRAAIPETPEASHLKVGDKVLADPAKAPWTVSKLYDDGSVEIINSKGNAKYRMKGVNALAKKVVPEGATTPQSPAAPGSTYSGVVGDKLDSRRTAFAADSGTLGIPRDQMPQVAAEHRGAMAQFLQARGMSVSAQDEAPSSLKPSQGEFNPGKVAKAGAIREAGDATPRRILTSSDGHVIDGHHQWLDRLQNAPDEPMPTLKINAPARDILSQIHEFPSADMPKAPDIASAEGGESSQTPAQALPVRQPVTAAGKEAANVIGRLTGLQAEGKTLSEMQEKGLAEAQYHLARDLNRQVLGPNARPTTEAGKRALANLHQMETYKAKGMPLKPGDYDTARAMNRILEADRTAQRQAIEAKQAQAPSPSGAATSQTSALSRNEPALSQNEPTPPANSSPERASAPSTPASSTPPLRSSPGRRWSTRAAPP